MLDYPTVNLNKIETLYDHTHTFYNLQPCQLKTLCLTIVRIIQLFKHPANVFHSNVYKADKDNLVHSNLSSLYQPLSNRLIAKQLFLI